MRKLIGWAVLLAVTASYSYGQPPKDISEAIRKYEAVHPGVQRWTDNVSDPKLIYEVAPRFPKTIGKRIQIIGREVIYCIITTKGHVEDPVVLRSQYPDFDRFWLDAVKKWKYQPAKRKGKPIAIFYTITGTVEF